MKGDDETQPFFFARVWLGGVISILALLFASGCEPGAIPERSKIDEVVWENSRRAERMREARGVSEASGPSLRPRALDLGDGSDLGCCEAHDSPGCAPDHVERGVCNEDIFCCTASWDGGCWLNATLRGACAIPAGDRTEPCCETHASTGCQDAAVSECTCGVDPYCCTVAWDGTCTTIAQNLCAAGCTDPDDCCAAHTGAGCIDTTVQAQVAALDSHCINYAWDSKCALLAAQFTSCTPPSAGTQECCTAATDGSQGCSDPLIQNCVCAADSWCCDVEWDDRCVRKVSAEGCSDACAAPLGGGCCGVRNTPGCRNESIEACVCGIDPFCCAVAWDSQCANLVGTQGCPGNCAERTPRNRCCSVSNARGCRDPEIEACVCEGDPQCCTVGWDEQCVANVYDMNCGTCARPNGRNCCRVARGGRGGCNQEEIEACVCAQDNYCCAVHWDALCVTEVGRFGCSPGGFDVFQEGHLHENLGAVPGHATDRTGWGQSVVITDDGYVVQAVYVALADGFDSGADNVVVEFRFWDSGSNLIKTLSRTLSSSWPATGGGDWLRFPEHGGFDRTLSAGTYYLTVWTTRGPDQGRPYNTDIKYAVAGPGTPPGQAYTMTGDQFADFSVFPGNWAPDPTKDLNYRILRGNYCGEP